LLKLCRWCGNDENTRAKLDEQAVHLTRMTLLPQLVRPSDPIFTKPYDIKL
jgi:hypothetical protein